jgi:hypothetical protein
MLDFNHVVNAPGFNVQTFYGTTVGTTLREWNTWIKPRGSRMLWIIAVGGGGAGGNSHNNATSAGGGGGGGSGAQSSVIIPSAFVPDTLYIQAGRGGTLNATEGGAGVAGLPTYVSLEPDTTLTATNTLLFANGGGGGGGTTTTAAGAAGTAGAVATLPNMPLAGRGIFQFFAGQAGAAGGNGTTPTAGGSITLPVTGLMVSGGCGGGGKTATTFTAGGSIIGPGSGEFYPDVVGGLAAVGATPARPGGAGIITRNFLMNYGGGGGGSASATSGGNAGNGGDAAPGAGGGGAGASSSVAGTTTLALAGRGGDGFVIFLSW